MFDPDSPVAVAYRAREEAMRPVADKLFSQYARGLITLAEVTAELTVVLMSTYMGCEHCGWQYDADTLASAAAGRTRLDMHPTHLCTPVSTPV